MGAIRFESGRIQAMLDLRRGVGVCGCERRKW